MPMITALFDKRGVAQQALEALLASGIARDRIAVIGEHHPSSEMAPTREVPADRGDLAALDALALPQEDARLFAQGLRQGHALLSARVDGDRIEAAIRTVEMFDPIDLDSRSEAWLRGEGRAAGGAGGGIDVGGPLGAGLTGGMGQGNTNLQSIPGSGALADDASTLGTADLRADPSLSDQGRSALPTGGRGAEERAGAPGTLELGPADPSRGHGVPGRAPQPNLHRRDTARRGRVRSYVREGE